MVAVKVLALGTDSDVRLAARFEREAKAAASISHPNVVALHRFGRLGDGTPFLVLQYVRGYSLADRLAIEGAFGTSEVRRLMAEMAGALAAAHARGIIHRDVRPPNILWEEETGRFLLTDFGVAGMVEQAAAERALTQVGERIGDIRYISPEQFRGERVSEAADVYSLAIVAFEALTGAHPGGGLESLAGREQGRAPTVEDVPGDDRTLARLIVSCLSNDAHQRPTATMIVRMLQQPSGTEQSSDSAVPEPGNGSGIIALLRRKRLPQWLGAAAATGWVILEFVDQLDQQGILHPVVYPLTLISLIAALGVTAILAWFHGEHGTQTVSAREKTLLAIITLLWLVTTGLYITSSV